MKTLYDYPFPMTDGALGNVPPKELADALIAQACVYCGRYAETQNIPCWVFTELGIGMDHSFSFVLVEFADASNKGHYDTTTLSLQQAFRLLRMYYARHQGSMV